MAKEITKVKSDPLEEPSVWLSSSDLPAYMIGHEDAIREMLELLDVLKESGLIPLVRGIVRNSDYILSEAADQLSSKKNANFVSNMLAIYSLFSSIDSSRLASFTESIAETLNNADSLRQQGSLGLLSLLNEMKDRDLSAGLRVVIAIIKGLTHEHGGKR